MELNRFLRFKRNLGLPHLNLQTDVGPYRVSTVHLPIDHGFDGKPLWYETMIFKGESWIDLYCDRYETKEEAEKGHQRAVKLVEKGESFNADA